MSQELTLNCYNLTTHDEINTYKEYLNTFKGKEVFYVNEMFNDNNEQENVKHFFVLKEQSKNIVLMPFLLRKIKTKKKSIPLFDVTSFYGYSGPLYNDDLSEDKLVVFWKLVDQWYKNNNVISEFIRFNLDGNHTNYNGHLIPTLLNVKGRILENEEEQWNTFIPKIRNNYRKATNNNLYAKVFDTNISENTIHTFHTIYISTMQRNNADESYFFSLEFFTNLIHNNPNKCALVIIYLDKTPISTELVLLNNQTIYSFLGGTISDFFNYRPNDFLKIEVLKWGRNNGYKFYILGGGRKDNDNLYKYKKTL